MSDAGLSAEKIDKAFVETWASKYPVAAERELFERVGPSVAERGHYVRDDFVAVGRWKAARATSRMQRNSKADIEDVTRLAFCAHDRFKHLVLALLDGVGVPMASALLTVWAPDRFTVIDFRALETLGAFGELDERRPPYPEYLGLCRGIASRTGSDLRSLDRALWQWSKEQGSTQSPEDSELAG